MKLYIPNSFVIHPFNYAATIWGWGRIAQALSSKSVSQSVPWWVLLKPLGTHSATSMAQEHQTKFTINSARKNKLHNLPMKEEERGKERRGGREKENRGIPQRNEIPITLLPQGYKQERNYRLTHTAKAL